MNERNKVSVLKFFMNLLELYEFDLKVEKSQNDENKKVFVLEDLQRANLGNIEGDEFDNLAEVMERLDIYHNDYIYEPLQNRIMDKEVISKDDYIAKCFIESNLICEVLKNITQENYNKLLNMANDLKQDDIKYILQAEDDIYKRICEKYIATFSNEMIIESNDEVIHFQISDEFIDLKEKGKINIDNYRNYLDDYDCIYRYESYKEFFESYVSQEICNDMKDEGLINEENEWTFYLEFDELQQVGLGYLIKDYYPLINQYILADKINIADFFQYFKLEQLDIIEKTLDLYFNTENIKFDKESGAIYSENYDFNINVVRLVEGLISYDDFINDYKKHEYEKDLIYKYKIIEYFKENGIKNLKQYGSDGVEGLYNISFLVSNLLDKLDIKYSDIVTEDVSDGKFETTIYLNDEQRVYLYTKPQYTAEMVADDLTKALCDYEKELQNQDEMKM